MAKARSTSARVSQPRSCAVAREHRQSVAAVEDQLAPRVLEILFGEQHLWSSGQRHRADEALPLRFLNHPQARRRSGYRIVATVRLLCPEAA